VDSTGEFTEESVGMDGTMRVKTNVRWKVGKWSECLMSNSKTRLQACSRGSMYRSKNHIPPLLTNLHIFRPPAIR
jgi:hypothetical protein